MTNNLQVFLNLREQLSKICNCDAKNMKCDGDFTCCPKKKNQRLQEKSYIMWTLLAKDERNELNKIDNIEYFETEYTKSDKYQLFLEEKRQQMIDSLPRKIIYDLGLAI